MKRPRRPTVEIVPSASKTLDELRDSINIMNVILTALLTDSLANDPTLKMRLLAILRTIRDNAGMVPEFKRAYDHAINFIETLLT